MKNLMEHKGYFAKIEYSTDDACFFGTLIGINDAISFEGECAKSLKEAFIEAIDDYLDICKRIGKVAEKPYKGSFNVRISPDLHKKAVLTAASQKTTLNKITEKALSQYCNAN